jgi:hypothetical protein
VPGRSPSRIAANVETLTETRPAPWGELPAEPSDETQVLGR